MPNSDQLGALRDLMDSIGLSTHYDGMVELIGKDPVLASPHKVGEAVSIALLLAAVATSVIWKHRTNIDNNLKIDIRDAIHYLHPVHFVWQSGYNMDLGADKVEINFNYKTKTERSVWIQCGPPYPKLQDGYLNFFNCGNNRAAIGKVIEQWDAFELEKRLAELGLPCCVVRTKDEWRNHPQGKLLLNSPVIEIEKISSGVPSGLKKDESLDYPLEGVNVLDMTHVLAGPRAAMSLAEFGANVLYVASPNHLDPKTINLGVNHGKKSTYLDLEDADDLNTLQKLLIQTDVFTYSYRPTVAQRLGLEPKDICGLNPKGMIYLSINAFGHEGPWKLRPGFDQNAQMVTGFSATEGGSLDTPKPSPVYYINDLLSAYFASAGIMTALHRRATEGGSYHVKVSLARSCMWVQDLGLIMPEDYLQMPKIDNYPKRFNTDPDEYTYLPKFITETSPYGDLVRLAPAVDFSNMRKIKKLIVVPYGSCKPEF